MVTYQIELDVSHEAEHSEVLQFATEHNCTADLIMEFGPAGGNPLYLFKSDSFDCLHELASGLLQYDATDVIEQI